MTNALTYDSLMRYVQACLVNLPPEQSSKLLIPQTPTAEILEDAKKKSADGHTLVVVQPRGTDSTDESFSNRFGCWNVTMLAKLAKAAEPTFGPHQMPHREELYKIILEKHDWDPQLRGKMEPAQLIRPCIGIIALDDKVFFVDGTNRLINLWEAGYRRFNTYLFPQSIADLFKIRTYMDGKEIDYHAHNMKVWGRFTSSSGEVRKYDKEKPDGK